jgi:hypothetical protein
MQTIVPSDPMIAELALAHNLSDGSVIHDNLDPKSCHCRRDFVLRPTSPTGEVCTSCGGMMVRTGTCTACMECGNTGGCS